MLSIKKSNYLTPIGFSLIELLIIIAIIGVIISLVVSNLSTSRKITNVVVAGEQQKLMTSAIEMYFDDIGFYPPDVNRGWDPGFTRSLPWNPDEEAGDPPPGGFAYPGTNCSHCPSNWETLVQERWQGPYMQAWPRFTPWDGKYDYNYWGDGASRYGCTLSPGIYVGVQGDYENNNSIPESAEEKMIENEFDAEQCLNGESQLLLWSLE